MDAQRTTPFMFAHQSRHGMDPIQGEASGCRSDSSRRNAPPDGWQVRCLHDETTAISACGPSEATE
jgi:hypothetical protein